MVRPLKLSVEFKFIPGLLFYVNLMQNLIDDTVEGLGAKSVIPYLAEKRT